ncbi:general transcription factor 3C polypeptide 1 [Trichonephila clavata]|uniref:General transcription factor 3C polypeptide 1 n=1 Tax=Trichonephila clavata TaxID=2740835 RepID=A0A8X6G2I6_TRICU|nr:general transcription factor 3C polypeptide 1 [Trichonephila clavata]
MASNYDFMNGLLDEIALEGLDGITLEMLWKRITDRPRFPIPIDDDSKEFLWNQSAKHNDIEIYKLSKPRECSPIFNRCDDKNYESNIVEEFHMNISDPHLPIVPVEDGNIRGSCSNYKTRKCITSNIRNGNVLHSSLRQVMEKWGNSLVLVASPKIRLLSLIGTVTDPLIDMTLEEYCLLERIGRSRYLGEVPQGKGSSQATKAFFCKQLHYYLKKLTVKGLITKQNLNMRNKKGKMYIGNLFHLKRFYTKQMVKMTAWMKHLCDILKEKPQKREACRILKTEVGISDKTLRILTNRSFEKWVKFTTISCRELYANGSHKDWYTLKGHEKMVKVVQLVKHYDENSEKEDDDEDSEQDEHLSLNCYFDASKIYYGKSLLQQLYCHIKNYGPEGISSGDLGKIMTLPKLDIRNLLRALSKNDCIITILEDRGRQKVKKYVAETYANENKHYSALKERSTIETIKPLQLISSNADLDTDTDVGENEDNILVSKTDKRCDNESDAVYKNDFKMNMFENLNVETEVRELENVPHSTEKPFRTEIFPHNVPPRLKKTVSLTDRKLKRSKMILDHLKWKRFSTRRELHQYITKREREESYNFKLDIRSLASLLNKLHDSKKIKIIKVALKSEDKGTELEFICDNSTTASDPRIQNAIQQAKSKLIGAFKKSYQNVQKNDKPDYSCRYQSNKSNIKAGKTVTAVKMQKSSLMLQHSEENLIYPCMTPKFERAKILHLFLHYIVYQHKGNTKNNDQQRVYHKSKSWKRFVPPLPDHDRHGCCLLTDIYSNIPLSLLTKISNLAESIPELICFLKDKEKAHYLMKYLPQEMQNKLMGNRKYLFFLMDVIKILCHMGLISICPQVNEESDQVFLFVHRYASIKDTASTFSDRLDFKDINFKTKLYKFEHENDVKTFWLDLKRIAFQTPVNVASGKIFTGGHFDGTVKEMTKNKTFDEIKDDGSIPGDGLGVGGFDSTLFLHCKQNWQFISKDESSENTLITDVETKNISNPLKNFLENAEIENSEIQTKLRRLEGSSLFVQKHRVERNRKDKDDSQLNYGNGKESGVSKEQTCIDMKIRRDKKGKWQENGYENENNDNKEDNDNKRSAEVEQLSKKRKATELKVEICKSKKRIRYLDEKDKAALKNRDKIRCHWSSIEDSFLLLCRVVSFFLDPVYCKNTVIPYTAVRDLLHKHVPGVSKDKSSKSCERRIRYMMSNPVTMSNINMFLQEALEDTELVQEFSQPKPPKNKTDEWINMFTRVLTKLQEKFASFAFERCKMIFIPNSLKEFHGRFNLKYFDEKDDTHSFESVFNKPENVEDIKKFVLVTLIFSRLAAMDDDTYTSDSFRTLYQLYPRKALRSVIVHLRKKRIISADKTPYHQSSNKYNNPYKFSNMYNFGMLTKFPKKNLKESQILLDVLSSAGTEFYVELMGDVPSGYSAAVLSLITTKQLCLHAKLPPQAILFNTSISEEIKTNIVKRMINTLEDEEFSDMTISSDDEDIIIKSTGVGKETEKKHPRRKCTKLTKMEEMSSANISELNNSQASVEQLFINASRLALFLLRHEYSISPFEKVCNAQDYVVLNTCQVYCHLIHNNNTDLPINPPDIIETKFF